MINIPFLQQYNWLGNERNVERILNKYDNFIFISPHLDDAVLSCGNLLEKLKNCKKNVLVVTVFNKCTKNPPTTQAKDFLKACKYDSGLELFKDRIKEDIVALNIFKAKHVHLGFIDAAWRVDENNIPIYKTSDSQFSGKISTRDNKTINNVGQKLKKYLQSKDTLILAPLGVGNHADHLIINKIAKKISRNVIFWEDYPYNRSKKHVYQARKKQNVINLFKIKNLYSLLKERAIKSYKSQIKSLFPHDMVGHTIEKYYQVILKENHIVIDKSIDDSA